MSGLLQPKPAQIHHAARQGVQTPSGRLPHADAIQRAFGRHDISSVQAHVGSAAAATAQAMGAAAYATGDHVVFAGQPSLRTVAHEAAHVVQQRGGVQLLGGVGQVGDVYERHADAVADRVASGRSAEDLLTPFAGGGGGSGGGGVQMQTTIGHRAGNFTYTNVLGQASTARVGVEMLALLDPNDPKTGSAPGAAVQNGLMGRLNVLYPGAAPMIRGHLLNGNLGGLGIAENLYPITAQANRQHEREVENHVKNEIRNGNSVRYRVNVVNATNNEANANATFRCRLERRVGGAYQHLLLKEVNSRPGNPRATQGNTAIAPTGTVFDRRLWFRNSNLPLAWRERGSGLRNDRQYAAATGAYPTSTGSVEDTTNNTTHAHLF